MRIVLLHDDKPGHRSQLEGLTQALIAASEAQVQHIDVTKLAAWRLRPPRLAPPDIVIGAGHRSHRWIIQWGRQWRSFKTVVMRPTLPLSWFDAVICPQHDRPPARANVLTTRIALNPMTPVTSGRPGQHGKSAILLGGPSKHFDWQDDALVQQMQHLLSQSPTQWLLAPSRRSPEHLVQRLLQTHTALELWPSDHPLTTLLHQIDQCWVTPDSFSMISECLSAGIPTGVFQQSPVANSRVASGVHSLIEENWLSRFDLTQAQEQLPVREPLDENSRAARWLLSRWRQWQMQT